MKVTTAAALLALAAEGASAQRTPKCHCCAELSKAPGLKVYTEADNEYSDRLSKYYSANAAQAPWCMVFPESTEQVSQVTKILTENQCPFGMRSGAHSAFKGSNSIKEGVTVDFGRMAATTYNETTQIASVQPGSTWGPVYQTLAEYGVVAIGGRADVVGVGGFTTGSGYSFHTNVRGFACDNVVNFEVVLADGSIVNANADSHPDLWRALKGGSGNFGFVTRLDVEVWPENEIYASVNGFDLSNRDKVFQAYADFIDRQDADPASQVILASTYENGVLGIGAVFSNIDAEEAAAFDGFVNIGRTYTVPATGPAHQVVPMFTGYTPPGLPINWQTGTVGVDVGLMAKMINLQEAYVAKMDAAAPGAVYQMLFQWQPVTQGIVDKGTERGGNALGLDAVVADGPVLMYNIVLTCDTDANQDILMPLAVEFRQAVNAAAAELGLFRNWEFMNYAHGMQDPIRHYGAESNALLKGVAAKYDPEQVFQKLRQTGFHLP